MDVDGDVQPMSVGDRVPPEILMKIFEWFATILRNDYGSHTLRWLTITTVSRSWRDVSLQLPSLWTFLDPVNWSEEQFRTFLERSRSFPLTLIFRHHYPRAGVAESSVTVRESQEDDYTESFQYVLSCINRVQDLRIRNKLYTREVLQYLLKLQTENSLHVSELTRLSVLSSTLTNLVLHSDIFQNLTDLTLTEKRHENSTRPRFTAFAEPVEGLLKNIIWLRVYGFRLRGLLALLAQCSDKLEELEYSSNIPNKAFLHPRSCCGAKMSFPRLRKIMVETYGWAMHIIFRRLALRKTVNIEIRAITYPQKCYSMLPIFPSNSFDCGTLHIIVYPEKVICCMRGFVIGGTRDEFVTIDMSAKAWPYDIEPDEVSTRYTALLSMLRGIRAIAHIDTVEIWLNVFPEDDGNNVVNPRLRSIGHVLVASESLDFRRLVVKGPVEGPETTLQNVMDELNGYIPSNRSTNIRELEFRNIVVHKGDKRILGKTIEKWEKHGAFLEKRVEFHGCDDQDEDEFVEGPDPLSFEPYMYE